MDPFGTLSAGGSRLPKINDNNGAETINNSTSYGAWNKLTKSDLIVRQANILDENRIVLYKRGK